jgi:proteic killer suppression protein
MAILSFKCDETQRLFETGRSQRFGAIRKVATRKLTMLDAAPTLESLKSPPGNNLEALSHDRKGQHSVRISDQWRLCFVWTDAGPTEVEITNHYR